MIIILLRIENSLRDLWFSQTKQTISRQGCKSDKQASHLPEDFSLNKPMTGSQVKGPNTAIEKKHKSKHGED